MGAPPGATCPIQRTDTKRGKGQKEARAASALPRRNPAPLIAHRRCTAQSPPSDRKIWAAQQPRCCPDTPAPHRPYAAAGPGAAAAPAAGRGESLGAAAGGCKLDAAPHRRRCSGGGGGGGRARPRLAAACRRQLAARVRCPVGPGGQRSSGTGGGGAPASARRRQGAVGFQPGPCAAPGCTCSRLLRLPLLALQPCAMPSNLAGIFVDEPGPAAPPVLQV